MLKRSVLSQVPEDERQVLWTFSPLTYGLEDYFDHTVYHSVDLLHTFPGAPRDLLLELERALVKHADEVIVSSRGLAEHVSSLGRTDARLWENVAETALFAESASSGPRPNRVIFSGNLTPTKVDFDLLFDTAALGCELVLAGPIAVDGTDSREKLEALLAHPNVNYLGVLSLQRLAAEVGKSRVGLIPYVCNDHTDGIFPMKVYEYVAGGSLVVSTPLKSLQTADLPAAVVLEERADFVEGVRRALLDHATMPVGSLNLGASNNSWESRIAEAQDLLNALSAVGPAHG
jgi:hypothetical protein